MDELQLNQKVFVWSIWKKNRMVNVRSYFRQINTKHILDICLDHYQKTMMTELDRSLTQFYEQQCYDKQQAIQGFRSE